MKWLGQKTPRHINIRRARCTMNPPDAISAVGCFTWQKIRRSDRSLILYVTREAYEDPYLISISRRCKLDFIWQWNEREREREWGVRWSIRPDASRKILFRLLPTPDYLPLAENLDFSGGNLWKNWPFGSRFGRSSQNITPRFSAHEVPYSSSWLLLSLLLVLNRTQMDRIWFCKGSLMSRGKSAHLGLERFLGVWRLIFSTKIVS